MKNKKLLEYGKTLLIVLLLISAVVLLKQTGYYSAAFDKFGGNIGPSRNTENTVSGTNYSGMAQPMGVSVSLEGGGRYASLYNKERVEEDYGRFSAFVAEALGSAGEVVEVDSASWIRALEYKSVYICYHSPQSFGFLSSLLGTSPGASIADYSSDELCLSVDNGVGRLYFRSGDKYYYLDTSVSVSALEERISEYIPNKCIFSHGDRLLYGLKDSFLIVKNLSEAPAIKSSVPDINSMVSPIMSALGVNEYTASAYRESDGTAVYVDSNSILRVTSSGLIRYEMTGTDGAAAAENRMDELFRLCWEMLYSCLIPYTGKAEVYLASNGVNEEGIYEFTYDYLVNGIPVSLGGRHAAKFGFDGGKLVSAEFYIRSFSVEAENLPLLPMYQAAAIASSERSEKMKLMYVETSEGFDCIWVDK